MKVGAIGKSKPVSGNSEPPPPAEQEHAEAEEHDQEHRTGFLVVEDAEQDEEQHETVQPIYQAWGAATDAERKQFAEQHWAEVARSARRQQQKRLHPHALLRQLQIGKAALSIRRPRHRSALVVLRRSGALALQRLDIAWCGLVQQILQSAPVIQTALHLRHKLFRYVYRNATPLRTPVQHITLMLLARLTSRAGLADAPRASQAQRTKNCRPKRSRFTLQPANDIRGRFRINMFHVKHVSRCTYLSQLKSVEQNRKKPAIFNAIAAFATETRLGSDWSAHYR
jgi:hypothetical protein